jgi:hypothetical protein
MLDRAASLLLLANAAQFDSSACISAFPPPPSTSPIISSAFRLLVRGGDIGNREEAEEAAWRENDGCAENEESPTCMASSETDSSADDGKADEDEGK